MTPPVVGSWPEDAKEGGTVEPVDPLAVAGSGDTPTSSVTRADVHAATIADAHLRTPKVHGPDVSVGAARAFFLDGHVHALLLVDAGVLVAVVERDDLVGVHPAVRARSVGTLVDRIAGPWEDLEATRLAMAARAQRRLAVVDERGVLLGLLCLKRHGRGFCSAADVAARDAERRNNQVG